MIFINQNGQQGDKMNDKFFSLSEDKQHTIVDAGFRIFSQTSYKKTPVSEIASEAKISKSLLFHYFQNKKELYLFLWEHAAKLSMMELDAEKCYEKGNLFDQMEQVMEAKFKLLYRHPYMANFVIRAFYEKDSEIHSAIQKSCDRLYAKKSKKLLETLDPNDYRPGLDLEMMYNQMYWAAEGYLLLMSNKGPLNPEQMEKDFRKMLIFWRNSFENPERNKKE